MLNKVVIVSDGTKTLVHINGKTYGKNLAKVYFEHDSSERRRTAEIRLTADTMPVETMDENYFEEFLHKVMTSEIPKLDELTVIKNTVPDAFWKDLKADTEQYGEGAGMDENMIGFTTKKYVNSPIVQMSFLIYESDLYLLQKSKTWEKFRNFVEETQSKGNRMSLQEKIELLGKEEF